MKRFRPSVLVLMLLFGLPQRAVAEFNIKDYQELKKEAPKELTIWLNGYLSGVTWANTLSGRQHPPVFCAPGKLALSTENLQQVVDAYYERKSKEFPERFNSATPFGIVALAALVDAFPCK